MDIVNAVMSHVQANATAYGIGGALAVVIIVAFRKYTLPVLAYLLEVCIYMAILHVLICGFVVCANWFKQETAFRALEAERVAPGWRTPLVRFWELEGYSPQWIAYLEGVFLVLLIIVVWRYRPMKAQKTKPPKKPPTKNKPRSAIRTFESAGRSGVRKR
jgi:hypothetical protein